MAVNSVKILVNGKKTRMETLVTIKVSLVLPLPKLSGLKYGDKR